MMTGIYRHVLDSKSRLSIPSKLREELGDTFYITISMEKCLTAYSSESWNAFSDKYNSMSMVNQRKMRPLLSHAAKVELDTQGRILLPQSLKDYAGITKNVAVIGAGRVAEFWDEERWDEVDNIETTPENLAEIFEELNF